MFHKASWFLALAAVIATANVFGDDEEKGRKHEKATATITGHGTVVGDPDLAGFGATVSLRCYQTQTAAEQAAAKAINLLEEQFKPFRGSDREERVIVPTISLKKKTETRPVVKQDKDRGPVTVEEPIADCIDKWSGDLTVILLTKKVNDLGKAQTAVRKALKEAKVGEEQDAIKDSHFVAFQPAKFWLTDEGKKPYEDKALDKAYAHQEAKFEKAKKNCAFSSAKLKELNEGTTTIQPHAAAAMFGARASLAPLAPGGSASDEPIATSVTSAGVNVTASVSAVYWIDSPDKCAVPKKQ